MIVDISKKILIVGLGLLGGSYAKVLKRFGFYINAITLEQGSSDYAVREGLINEGSTEVDERMKPLVNITKSKKVWWISQTSKVIDKKYSLLGKATFDGICTRYLKINADGELNLGGICLVAGLGPDNNRRRDGSYEYYRSEPIVENDAKGVAPFLLCYTEIQRMQGEKR